MISKEVESQMKDLIDLVVVIRNIRSVWNIDPQTAVSAILNVQETKTEKLLCENEEFIKRMAKVSSLKIGKSAKPKNSAVSVLARIEVYVPLEGLIDFNKEKGRLEKEETRISGEIKSLSARLEDKNFTAKAPKEVVRKQELYKHELEIRLKKLKDNLKEIG